MADQRADEELTWLRSTVAELVAKDSIRDCLFRYCRGIDRIDRDLIASAFHADAYIAYGKLYDGALEGFLENAVAAQHRQTDCQHLVGNILIECNGDVAMVESYEIARHLTPLGDEVRDMVLASRMLDRFERRDGRWAIVYRTKVMDSGRFIVADRSIHDGSPMPLAARDGADPSYALFAGGLGTR